eukprot:EC795185.1.p1 GENE.EC795185.1~~EC795185.1.p1  ORF type:complete len:174 (+),score=35.91 EC795185.1:74-595(+)
MKFARAIFLVESALCLLNGVQFLCFPDTSASFYFSKDVEITNALRFMIQSFGCVSVIVSTLLCTLQQDRNTVVGVGIGAWVSALVLTYSAIMHFTHASVMTWMWIVLNGIIGSLLLMQKPIKHMGKAVSHMIHDQQQRADAVPVEGKSQKGSGNSQAVGGTGVGGGEQQSVSQ